MHSAMLYDPPRTTLQLPRAMRGEPVDILSFVVTGAGWVALQDRIGILPSNPVRILTRLIYPSAVDEMERAGIRWHALERNHAKVILYRDQKVAVLGSANITSSSLASNIESLSGLVKGAEFTFLAEQFDRYWQEAEENGHAQRERDRKAIIQDSNSGWGALANAIAPEEIEGCHQEAWDGCIGLLEDRRPPWPFQEKIIREIKDWLDTRPGRDLGRIVTLPTGAGKTLVAAELIRELLKTKPEARILWVCHRVELLRQSAKAVRSQMNGLVAKTSYFVPEYVCSETGSRNRYEFADSRDRQLVFSTQGMLPHLLRYNRSECFNLVVVDECHRCHPGSKSYRDLYKFCMKFGIPRLGLSATPLDPEKRDFGKYWDTESMFGGGLSWDRLVEQGYLARINLDLTKLWPTGYKFKFCSVQNGTPARREKELLARVNEFNNESVNDHVLRAWAKYRDKRRRILCFAVCIEQVEDLVNRLQRGDQRVRAVHSRLSVEENRRNLEWFRDRDAAEPRMLVSVLIAAEGLDLPATDCLFMVRPTFSPELYKQMIGRGLRGPKAGGTEDCAVVDFTYQFVDSKGQLHQDLQVTSTGELTREKEMALPIAEEDEEADDCDASSRISTVADLKKEVAKLQQTEGLSVQQACEELSQELDYSPLTLMNYLYTKPDDYPLGWEDPESDETESCVNITRAKLQDLRIWHPQSFARIAKLTTVTPGTLQAYCSDPERFRRWKDLNRDKMSEVRAILAEFRD